MEALGNCSVCPPPAMVVGGRVWLLSETVVGLWGCRRAGRVDQFVGWRRRRSRSVAGRRRQLDRDAAV